MYVAHLIKVKGEIEGVRNGECVRRWKGREEKGGSVLQNQVYMRIPEGNLLCGY